MKENFGEDWARIGRTSIIEESEGGKYVRMANLALVACHTVNGVASIHSDLIKQTIFKDFYEIFPDKFQNKTNGVTPRRWLAFCNPGLRALITQSLGTEAWITNLSLLQGLREFADDPEMQSKWRDVKQIAKKKLSDKIKSLCGLELPLDSLYDVQVKRIHEYKRQLLNILGIIWRYKQIKSASPEERKKWVPRVFIIGGKAAPGYEMAKRIIKLVNAVGDKVNNDSDVSHLLKVVFIPDYNVSLAEIIIPGSDISEHISTAGTEASGTSNMKFIMNGALIIGTMDGANVEIAEEISRENMFIFGATACEVPELRAQRKSLSPDYRFEEVCQTIRNGVFGWPDYFMPIIDGISAEMGGDYYLVANDFPDYINAQDEVDKAYKDQVRWTKMSILSVAGAGKFTSDRTIEEYAKDIWKIKPMPKLNH